MKTNLPTHEAISRRAQEIWQSRGSPLDQDNEIWLEAERQLSTPTAANNSPSATGGRGNGNTQEPETSADPKPSDLKPKPDAGKSAGKSKGDAAQTERLKGEMASESAVEFNISPPVSQDEAIKAALQKKDARAPQAPVKEAPHAKPTESGKPVWPKPHSS